MIYYTNKRSDDRRTISNSPITSECTLIESLSKTLCIPDDVCDTKLVDVKLTIKFNLPLRRATITDVVNDDFIESIVRHSVVAKINNTEVSEGNVRVDFPEIRLTNLSIRIGDTLTLRYRVKIKDNAINNPDAYVNKKVIIDDTKCGRIKKVIKHEDGKFQDDLNITCPDDNCCCQACYPFTVEPCDTVIPISVEVPNLQCNGKLVDVSVDIDNVCSGRRIAVGVNLVEINSQEVEEPRGFLVKEFTTPNTTPCTSFTASGFCFPITDLSGCVNRKFKAKIFADYTDVVLSDCDCDTK